MQDKQENKMELQQIKYVGIKILGKGSFGEVYLATHTDTKSLVAVKVLQLEHREKATNEAEILRSIDHPCVIHYLEKYETQNKICIVTEYADGMDL